MALNSKRYSFVLSLFFILACQKPILPTHSLKFETCQERFKALPSDLKTAKLEGTFHLFEPGHRTVSFKTRMLVSENKLYLEFDALGLPGTVVSWSEKTLTIYQPFEQRAYRQKNSVSMSDVLMIDFAWQNLVNLLLQNWMAVAQIDSFSKNCTPLTATLATGEHLEWDKKSLKITHDRRWIKWTQSSIQKNPQLNPEWFEISLPNTVRLLDNPAQLR